MSTLSLAILQLQIMQNEGLSEDEAFKKATKIIRVSRLSNLSKEGRVEKCGKEMD